MEYLINIKGLLEETLHQAYNLNKIYFTLTFAREHYNILREKYNNSDLLAEKYSLNLENLTTIMDKINIQKYSNVVVIDPNVIQDSSSRIIYNVPQNLQQEQNTLMNELVNTFILQQKHKRAIDELETILIQFEREYNKNRTTYHRDLDLLYADVNSLYNSMKLPKQVIPPEPIYREVPMSRGIRVRIISQDIPSDVDPDILSDNPKTSSIPTENIS